MSELHLISVGKIAGPFGVRGWLKVRSFTEPAEDLLHSKSWRLGSRQDFREWKLESGRLHGRFLAVKLAGCEDRDAAQALAGSEVLLSREQLPALAENEYYWDDLIGLRVINTEDEELGRVTGLMETGANDVLVVEGEEERLIPYVWEHVVQSVDLDAGELRVDWGLDY